MGNFEKIKKIILEWFSAIEFEDGEIDGLIFEILEALNMED